MTTLSGVLGIDVSKLNFDVALLDPSRPEAKPRHKAFPNTAAGFERLRQWLAGNTVHACLEATGTYGDALARFLHEKGHTVSVVNPARIKGFGQAQMSRTKTDKADAQLIARFCLLHRPEPWTPPAPEVAQLQALVRRLESLTEMRQMERNRRGVSPAVVQASIDAVLAVLDAQVEATQEAIQGHIDGSPTLRGQRDLLTSVPGIAGTTAAALLSELGDVSQFTGARQVAAFAGLVPRLRQSGQKKGHVCLSKVGTSRLRRALYMPAVSALRCNPALRALRARLLSCGKPKMLIVGAAMRKLLQIAFGVLKSGKPFDQRICMAALAGA
jgi:transposase